MEADRWAGLELRHLLALDAVAREGSFGRAAVSLGYTQSAISQQIAALERIVGERLLERQGGPAGTLGRRGGDPADRDLPERRRTDPPRRDAPLHRGLAQGRPRADGVG